MSKCSVFSKPAKQHSLFGVWQGEGGSRRNLTKCDIEGVGQEFWVAPYPITPIIGPIISEL